MTMSLPTAVCFRFLPSFDLSRLISNYVIEHIKDKDHAFSAYYNEWNVNAQMLDECKYIIILLLSKTANRFPTVNLVVNGALRG
jgi:hypothetical protein